MDADAVVALLKEILADLLRLPGAACIGKHAMFDLVIGNGPSIATRNRSG